MDTHAFVNWKSFLCDICTEHFIEHLLHIGGPGITVEMDERVFTMVMEQWVFGGIDTTSKQGFLVPVDNCNADTLLSIIQQYVLQGTTIVSDC